MKLAFVTDNGFSEMNGAFFYSGANVQHYATATQHFDEIIFVSRRNPYDGSGGKVDSKHHVRFVNPLTSIRGFFANLKKLDRILEETVVNSDAVMCFGLNGFFAYKKAKKHNKPVIAYVGGCVYDTLKHMNSLIKRISAPVMMYIIRDMVWNADFVHYVDQYLVNRYPTKGQYFVCPSCQVDVQEDTLEFRLEKLEQSADIITIGLIGYTHNRIKGVDTAIKALALLGPDYRIQIVGRGDHSWLNDLIMKLNLRSQIDFLGVLSGRDKVFEWLDTIDLYVQPSLTEGMPRATIEAMSRGCPVVVSDVGGLKNLVDKKYRIRPTDHEELAQKIRELSQNRTEMYQAAVANFEKAKEFDLTHLNKKRTEFYEMIINEVQGR